MKESEGHVTLELGAYVLGALEPLERHRVERHTASCPDCRDELARLSGMPSLLNRLSADEVLADLTAGPAARAARFTDRAAKMVDELQRTIGRWRVVAAIATLVALASLGMLVAPWVIDLSRPQVEPAELVAATAEAAATQGTAAAYGWEWGTTIHLDVTSLPRRDHYEIWVVDTDGEAHLAGTWGPTADRSANLRSATAVPRPRIRTIDVRDDAGAVLTSASMGASDDP